MAVQVWPAGALPRLRADGAGRRLRAKGDVRRMSQDQNATELSYDDDGCILLLAAFVRLWMRDARKSEHELRRLAAFLDRDVGWLRRRVAG